ncbi:Ciliary dynein heavy chain_ putative, partial [Caligus rogercresseyi]
MQGKILLIENLGEEIEPKGKAIKLGDKEVEYNAEFQLSSYKTCESTLQTRASGTNNADQLY